MSISLADARTVARAARAKADANNWNVVIAILDDGGHLLYLERSDDVQLGSIGVAQEKARTALLFRRPTKALEDRVNNGSINMLALTGATPIEGGLPLLNAGRIVGSIGVSGVQSAQDAEVAAAGAEVVARLP